MFLEKFSKKTLYKKFGRFLKNLGNSLSHCFSSSHFSIHRLYLSQIVSHCLSMPQINSRDLLSSHIASHRLFISHRLHLVDVVVFFRLITSLFIVHHLFLHLHFTSSHLFSLRFKTSFVVSHLFSSSHIVSLRIYSSLNASHCLTWSSFLLPSSEVNAHQEFQHDFLQKFCPKSLDELSKDSIRIHNKHT